MPPAAAPAPVAQQAPTQAAAEAPAQAAAANQAGGAAAAQASAAAAGTGKASATDGKSVFDGTCTACHSTGVAGAPKLGDKAAWAPRIAKGKDTLYHDALHGLNAMPPKGGNAALSDDAVKAAVDYMVSQAK